jgi:hypothetical protein
MTRDLHRLSRPDVAAQLIADIINRKVDEKKRGEEALRVDRARRKRRHRGWYFVGALPLLLGLTAWNVLRAANQPPVFNADERESVIRLQMYIAAQGIEAYRDSTGRWPRDLRAVGMDDAGLVYEVRDGSFAISDTSTTVPLTYRRGDPLAPFAAGYAELKHSSERGAL